MEATSDPSVWLLPIFLLGFPIFFVGLWSFISWLIAVTSGYRSLAPLRIDGAEVSEGEKLPTASFAMIGRASYRGGILSLRASSKGLTLRVSPLFPFHKPIRVPWVRLQEAEGGGLLFSRAPGSFLLDGRVRLRVPEATFAAICTAKARYGG